MTARMYCGGHGEWLPCATCARNFAKRFAPPAVEPSDDGIDEDRVTEAAEWEARDRFIEGYDA